MGKLADGNHKLHLCHYSPCSQGLWVVWFCDAWEWGLGPTWGDQLVSQHPLLLKNAREAGKHTGSERKGSCAVGQACPIMITTLWGLWGHGALRTQHWSSHLKSLSGSFIVLSCVSINYNHTNQYFLSTYSGHQALSLVWKDGSWNL